MTRREQKPCAMRKRELNSRVHARELLADKDLTEMDGTFIPYPPIEDYMKIIATSTWACLFFRKRIIILILRDKRRAMPVSWNRWWAVQTDVLISSTQLMTTCYHNIILSSDLFNVFTQFTSGCQIRNEIFMTPSELLKFPCQCMQLVIRNGELLFQTKEGVEISSNWKQKRTFH